MVLKGRAIFVIFFCTQIISFGNVLDVLLSDNNYPELPTIRTGAEYTLSPAPTNPADVVPRTQKFGRRLQDGDKPSDNWHRCVGWNSTNADIVFDLKATYLVDKVELRLMGKAYPKEAVIYAKENEEDEFKQIASKEISASSRSNFWLTITFDYVPARYVKIKLILNRWGFYLREVRIWGKLVTDDASKVIPVANSEGDKLVIISQGAANAAIVVADDASRKSVVAARFLQDFLKRMTGISLPLVTVSHIGNVKNRIYIGPELNKVGIVESYPGNERFIVKRKKSELIIAGNDVADYYGTKMGVCAFLESLGARFYRYDKPERYLIIPKKEKIVVGDLIMDQRPAFTRRSMWRPTDQAHIKYADLWWIWNRLGGLRLFTSHNEFISRKEFTKHPEYFAMINGKRTCKGQWQYCTSNKSVIAIAAKKAAEFFKKSPNSVSFSLSLRDCGGFCQCPNCRKIDMQYGKNPANRLAIFANAVRTELDKNFPQYKDKYLVFYAYWYTKCPPNGIVLKEKVVPIVVGDGCHIHLWNDRMCKRNVAIDGLLQGWETLCRERVAIYDWYIPGISDKKWEEFPWISITKPISDMKFWYTKRNVRWIQLETEHRMRWLPYRWITYYIAARGMWNPWQEPKAILRDLCEHLYGQASDVMFKLYVTLDDAMLNSKVHGKTWHLPCPSKIYSKQCREKVSALFEQALKLSKANESDYARVNDAFEVWNNGWKRLETLSEQDKKANDAYNPNLKPKQK